MTKNGESKCNPAETADLFPAPQAACYPGHWVGRFIWDHGESLPYNYYLMCRKSFGLDGEPQAARLHMTAALKYKVWVNGTYVGAGPVRSFPEWKSYDTHDLSHFLTSGGNVIAALCWYTGVPNNYSVDERAGLWAQLEYIDASDGFQVVGTDETWLVRHAQGFGRNGNHFRGIEPEVFDSRVDPQDWMSPGFDDSSWEHAACLISGEYRGAAQMMASWSYLEPRQTPPMREREVAAIRLAHVGEADADFYPDHTRVVERMDGQVLFPLQYAKAEKVEGLVEKKNAAVFQNNIPSSSTTPSGNLMAGASCFVFGPFEQDESLPVGEGFASVPEQMALGANVRQKQKSVLGSEGEIDLAPFVGGVCEHRSAYVFVPFSIEEERDTIVGAAADWWMECWLDGEQIFDTTHLGNGFHPPHFSNHRKRTHLAQGEHLLVARIAGGALGIAFSCGVVLQKEPGASVRDPFVTLDFGRTYNAFPCIEFVAPAGAVIEIAAGGEMLPDGRVTWGDDPNWTRSGSCIAAGGRQRWQVFEPIPVRFLQVVFRNIPHPIEVVDITLISWEYPAERRGAFACSDDVLTRLWGAGVDTAYLHMDDTVIFDVVRERAPWICNSEVEHGNLAIAAGYGDLAFSRWHLKQSLRSQLPNGMFRVDLGSYASVNAGFTCKAEPVRVSNCLYALNHKSFIAQNIHTWYWNFGDIELLKEWYPALTRLAEWNEGMADNSGLLYNLPGPVWFEWTDEQELHGAHFGSNVVYCMMLRKLAEIAGWLDLPEEAEQWSRRAMVVRDALRRMHWHEERGLFCDSVIDGRQAEVFTEVGNGMALYYDIADEAQKRRLVSSLTRDTNGCTRATTLYFYYLIEGLIRAGAVDYALKRLSAENRAMMERSDPPTFWEQWPDVPSTHTAGDSPLHFGGAGVVWTLSAQVLGVQPGAPAFGACRIQPKCGSLDWAKGVVPSVRGDVLVEWQKYDDAFAISVELPDSLPTEIVLPVEATDTSTLIHNGKHIPCRSSEQCMDGSDGFLAIRVNGGKHDVKISECSTGGGQRSWMR